MGTILKFAPAEAAVDAERTVDKPARHGEIIIFPGIRYERPSANSAGRPQSQRVQRDYLIL